MTEYSCTVFDSAGTLAIRRAGHDIAHVRWVDDDPHAPPHLRLTDAERQGIIDRISAALRPGAPTVGMAGWGCRDAHHPGGDWLSDGYPTAAAALWAAQLAALYLAGGYEHEAACILAAEQWQAHHPDDEEGDVMPTHPALYMDGPPTTQHTADLLPTITSVLGEAGHTPESLVEQAREAMVESSTHQEGTSMQVCVISYLGSPHAGGLQGYVWPGVTPNDPAEPDIGADRDALALAMLRGYIDWPSVADAVYWAAYKGWDWDMVGAPWQTTEQPPGTTDADLDRADQGWGDTMPEQCPSCGSYDTRRATTSWQCNTCGQAFTTGTGPTPAQPPGTTDSDAYALLVSSGRTWYVVVSGSYAFGPYSDMDTLQRRRNQLEANGANPHTYMLQAG